MSDYASGLNSTPLPSALESKAEGLSWNTKVADLLPKDWKLLDEYANEKANVIDALSHVTGMPRYVP